MKLHGIFKYTLFLLMLIVPIVSTAQNNITVTDISSHNPHPSSVLDVYSTSKGMLIPRLNASQIGVISSPATGLLVYNTTFNSFYFFNGSIWEDLSADPESLWTVNPSTGDVYLTDLQTNIGIGTNEPLSKLAVAANNGADPDDALFEIVDEFGHPIFSVTSEGVRVYVKDNVGKGVSGGFAIGRYGAAKGIPDTTFFLVTPDSTRVFTQEGNKGVSGGFAVGRYGAAKGVGNYMHMTENNYLIGHNAGRDMTTGISNLFLGFESGLSNTVGIKNTFMGHHSGYNNQEGNNNIFIGDSAGFHCIENDHNIFIGNFAGFFTNTDEGGQYGDENVFIGSYSGYSNIDGLNNVYIGNRSGQENDGGAGNVFIGGFTGRDNSSSDNTFVGGAACYQNTTGRYNTALGSSSGVFNITGSRNVFLGYQAGYNETASDKLYIESSQADANNALIYGEFDTNILTINGNLGISTVTPTEKLEIYAGNAYASSGDFYAGAGNGVINCGGGIMSAFANIISDGIVNNEYATGDEDLYIYDDLEVDGEAYKVGSGTWVIQSDRRLKKDISEYSDGLEQIMKIKPVYFRYNEKAGVSSNKLYVGLIAQDIKEIAPYTVELTPFNKKEIEDQDGNVIDVNWDGTEYYTFDPSALTYMLINGVKEQQILLNDQENRINKLEKDNTELRQLIEKLISNQ